ncbi:MAG: FMN-binding protein [Firmicutes bacterium]|nr:FMN-binding protein [Bacillota bacterium]
MKSKFAPTLVLGCICLVASLLLAATYQVTAPQIERIAIENANAARAEVMPEATGFSQVDCELLDGVTEVYVSDNEVGHVITSKAKGFGGDIIVMTAIKTDGTIEAIKVTDASNETPGLGSKTTTPEHAAKFVGASQITMDPEGEGQYTAPVSGATYSSRGVFNAVSLALQQYAQIGGAK